MKASVYHFPPLSQTGRYELASFQLSPSFLEISLFRCTLAIVSVAGAVAMVLHQIPLKIPLKIPLTERFYFRTYNILAVSIFQSVLLKAVIDGVRVLGIDHLTGIQSVINVFLIYSSDIG